jgi:hypothetical protein
MNEKQFLRLQVACMMLLATTSCTWGSSQYYDDEVPDREYAEIAQEHPHAQAFLERYPEAETHVDRSGRLAVDFRVTRRVPTDTTQNWEGVRLRVFIDPDTKQPADTFLQCDERILKDNVLRHLDEYFTTQACP